ncbi:MAG: cache domain-containing protein, partial [Lachnospiraceae bacterium]|nr:cache domain-containing protein [Lachnospiraceae bacterium]
MKRIKSVIKPTSAFSKILCQLVFMVCIGLGSFGFIASEICTRGMMDEAIKNNYLVLRQNQAGIENDLSRIKTVLVQAGQNRSVKKLMSLKSEEFNEYSSTTVQDVVMYLNSFKSTIDQINNVWIYQKNADTIISAEGRMNVGTYYSSNCRLENEVIWEDLYNTRFVTYIGKNNVIKGYAKTPVYIYGLTLPLALGYSKGYMAINVNGNIFDDRFESDSNPAAIYVLDENNEIVYMNSIAASEQKESGTALEYVLKAGERKEIKEQETVRLGKNKEYALMCIQSSSNGWKYCSLIPTDYIYRKAENIKRVCYFMILVSIIVSFFIAFRIILHLNKPITEILQYVRMIKPGDMSGRKSRARSELGLINDLISYIYDENEKLKKNIEQTRPFVLEKYLDKLLN